jgi:hypothetical protein
MVLVVAANAGCDGGDDAAKVEGTSIERTTRPTIAPATTTTAPTTTEPAQLLPPVTAERADDGPVHDWEGQHYDFGRIQSIEHADGNGVLTFDRMQIIEEDGSLHSGPTLSEEPIIVANTDTPFVNQSRALRTFSVAPDVVVKRLDEAWSCGPDGPPAPTWDEGTLDQLVADGVGDDVQDSLTFDAAGQVVQIRLSRGC